MHETAWPAWNGNPGGLTFPIHGMVQTAAKRPGPSWCRELLTFQTTTIKNRLIRHAFRGGADLGVAPALTAGILTPLYSGPRGRWQLDGY